MDFVGKEGRRMDFGGKKVSRWVFAGKKNYFLAFSLGKKSYRGQNPSSRAGLRSISHCVSLHDIFRFDSDCIEALGGQITQKG